MKILAAHPSLKMENEPFNPHREDWGKQNFCHAISNETLFDECIDRICQTCNGMKHLICQLPANMNEQLLERDFSRILLYRRNVLQSVISSLIAKQKNAWFGEKAKHTNARLDAVDIGEVSKRVIWQYNATNRYREFLARQQLDYLEVCYEDIFGLDQCLDNRLNVIEQVFQFVGVDSLSGAVMNVVCRQLDSSEFKLNSEATYRQIPNIDAVERQFGSTRSGFLFSDQYPIRQQPLPKSQQTPSRGKKVQDLIRLGDAFLEDGETNKALGSFLEAAERSSQFVRTHRRIKKLLRTEDLQPPQLRQLERFYLRICDEKDCANLSAYNLAMIYAQQNRLDDAKCAVAQLCLFANQRSNPEYVSQFWNHGHPQGPDFMVLGAMKCGTTSLYAYISDHPKILRAGNKRSQAFQQRERVLHWEASGTWHTFRR